MPLKIQEIVFQYDNKMILENLNLTFDERKTYVLLGKSGSGKSTILKLLAGILYPKVGKVYIDDEEMPNASHFLISGYPKVAILSQEFDLKINHTVFENLNRIFERVKNEYNSLLPLNLFSKLGIDPLLEKKAKLLSVGEKQRVALAVALLKNPNYIILDEPLSNLDIINRKIILDLLRELKGKKTIIIAMHEAAEALSIADEIILISNGKVIDSGRPNKIFYKPKTLYSAQLTGIVNIFNENEINKFSWDNKKIHKISDYYLIRPNQFRVNTLSGIPCKIMNQYFHGMYTIADIRAYDKIIEVFLEKRLDEKERWKLELIDSF